MRWRMVTFAGPMRTSLTSSRRTRRRSSVVEEAFEVFGQGEVGLAVGELGVENFDLVAQVGFPSAQIGHAGAQLRMTTPSLRRSSRP
jgi:hypothetical protein